MRKKITAIILTGAMCVSLMTGCGGINKNAVAASMDGADVSLELANFYCRFQQASMEDLYKVYFGDSVWTQDLYGNGSSFQETLKDSVMEMLHELFTLKLHMSDYGVELTADEKASVKQAAEAFMNDNSKAAIKEMGASEEIVEEFLELYTVQKKMRDAIEANADIDVPDEEANMRGYTQIKIAIDSYTDEEGNSVNYTDDEAAELLAKAKLMVEELSEEGATLETVAQAHECETSAGTYATYEFDAENEDDLLVALEGLKAGETSGLIETDNALYIARVDSDTDKEATEKNRESIIEQKKNDFYNETLESWQEDDEWYVDNKEMVKIQFENGLTVKAPES